MGAGVGAVIVGSTNYAANEVATEILQTRVRKLEACLETSEQQLQTAILEASEARAKLRAAAEAPKKQADIASGPASTHSQKPPPATSIPSPPAPEERRRTANVVKRTFGRIFRR
mmetsp:Transcript_3388/g.9751  ORF Transcript_3388/g.9751 Transcript_3388/m.9751 type:complete len:115 (-) Transcript_3388:226-570(-)